MAKKRSPARRVSSRARAQKYSIMARVAPAPDSDVDRLFGRITEILEQSRAVVVRSVNSQMVLAYWHIGREIVEVLQGGADRAAYGHRVLEALSQRCRSGLGSDTAEASP